MIKQTSIYNVAHVHTHNVAYKTMLKEENV